jgi:hypothetical protein
MKVTTCYGFSMRKPLFIALFIVIFLGANSFFFFHKATAEVAEVEKTITCYHVKEQKLVTHPESVGCLKFEKSLGDSLLEPTSERPDRVIEMLMTRFKAAQVDALKEGVHIHISSGYRTLKKQENLYKAAIKKHGTAKEAVKWVLPAEASRHPWGLALDVNLDGPKLGAAWLETYGATYGICRVYINEWWHFEPNTAPGGLCPALKVDASEDVARRLEVK